MMTEVGERTLVDEGALPPDDFHDAIERIREVAAYDLEIPPDLNARLEAATAGLLIDPETIQSAALALATGHLVLQGPPGTGKSTLARALAQAFHVTVLPYTAHSEWSTFEVIGRQELISEDGVEGIVPVNGAFTEAAVRCAGQVVRHFDAPEEPQATWLLIDELNRAQADRAFGELFSVLGTRDLVAVTLGFQREGNRELVTPRRLRIIGTVNSVDRQYVNGLGQGLRRRFSFVTVDIPKKRAEGEVWGAVGADASLAAQEFFVVARAAADRVASRSLPSEGNEGPSAETLANQLLVDELVMSSALFDLVERIRYAQVGPNIRIGTAQLIDTVELYLASRVLRPNVTPGSALDWAAATRLAPLLDSDTISPVELLDFAATLGEPFGNLFARELKVIAAAGSRLGD
jgi:MoxR-like ATPase